MHRTEIIKSEPHHSVDRDTLPIMTPSVRSPHNQAPVIVIGAGLAGLACAQYLKHAGIPVAVIEASDRPGGRVRTDAVRTDSGTHQVDRGFQVYLSAYPEGRRVLDLDALSLQSFASGARVRFEGAFHPVADPRRAPVQGLKTVLRPGPIMKYSDLAPLTRMAASLSAGKDNRAWEAPEETSIAYLRRVGLSEQVIDRFFRPFFGGVFLDRSLNTSARKLQYTFRMFARGKAMLPAGGMGAIPDQLAAGLDIHTSTTVTAIDAGQVKTAQSEYDASAIVIATSAANAEEIATSSGVSGIKVPSWKRTKTITFEASQPPTREPVLFLNGDGMDAGPINHVAVVSNVQPGYAPPGKAQICANIVAPADLDQPEPKLVADVYRQLVEWFGNDAKSWVHIHSDDIRCALPSEDAPALQIPQRQVTTNVKGVFLAGDYLENGSINGALESGRRAAEAVLAGRDG